jgi:site-specific DNA-methyltransferase (adenine-specific)
VTLEPYYEELGITIYLGDCRDVLPTLEASSFDACLCDPPYGLTANKKGGGGVASLNERSPAGRSRIGTGGGFMGNKWDAGVPGPETWAAVYRVLKPGAFLLAFGGTRTHHRLMCAIEDAGFEIRDCAMFFWLYGSGFPKSLDISKAIDKAAGVEREVIGRKTYAGNAGNDDYAQPMSWGDQASHKRDLTEPATDAAKLFDGYGTALKPAYEPIIVAMKPCEGTFAENALKHGVAGINIEAGRIGTEQRINKPMRAPQNSYGGYAATATATATAGRWPANVILNEESARMVDEQSGQSKSTGGLTLNFTSPRGIYGKFNEKLRANAGGLGDSGGASRFFYCAKASKSERGDGNNHPTVKPLKLIEYLARLILPPQGGKLLVPFSGSGSEMLGARNAGWTDVTGIELSAKYADIAIERLRQEVLPLEAETQQPEQMTL